jgi:hypothetical protein
MRTEAASNPTCDHFGSRAGSVYSRICQTLTASPAEPGERSPTAVTTLRSRIRPVASRFGDPLFIEPARCLRDQHGRWADLNSNTREGSSPCVVQCTKDYAHMRPGRISPLFGGVVEIRLLHPEKPPTLPSVTARCRLLSFPGKPLKSCPRSVSLRSPVPAGPRRRRPSETTEGPDR